MTTIPVVKTWPNDTVVDSIEGKITKVYEHKQLPSGKFGPTTIQNAELGDAGGQTIALKVWGHPDIKMYEGKEVIIHSVVGGGGKLGGVKVEHGSYTATKGPNTGKTVPTLNLSISKQGHFQILAVHAAQNPQPATQTPTVETEPVKTDSSPVSGQTKGYPLTRDEADALKAKGQRDGMCFKLAGDFWIARGNPDQTEDAFVQSVLSTATKLIAAAKSLE